MTETWEQGVLNVPRRRGKVMSLTQMYESMENHQPMTSGLQEIWGARPKCRHWIRVAFMALKGKSAIRRVRRSHYIADGAWLRRISSSRG